MIDTTAVLRSFNRTYTQRVGVLDESFLGTGRPLAASRLLHEIGTEGPASVADLRVRLGLDDGYLARLLRGLEAEGLLETRPHPADGRRRTVVLTSAGRASYADLEQRSEQRAEAILAPLTCRQRQRLGEALGTAELLVLAATVELRRVDAEDPGAVAALGHYYDELVARFPDGFDPGPSDPRDADATYLLATSAGVPVAYGGLRPLGDGVGEVKRMWVHAGWRGAGLGARMLRELEALAGEQGMRRVVLDTNSRLVEALALYERAGYTAVDRYNDNPYAEAFFAKDL